MKPRFIVTAIYDGVVKQITAETFEAAEEFVREHTLAGAMCLYEEPEESDQDRLARNYEKALGFSKEAIKYLARLVLLGVLEPDTLCAIDEELDVRLKALNPQVAHWQPKTESED